MKTGFLTVLIVWDSLTFEMQNLSVSVLSLLVLSLYLSLWLRCDYKRNYRYNGSSKMEQLVQSTTQSKRSIPHGDKLQWIHWSDEFTLFLLWWMWELLTNGNSEEHHWLKKACVYYHCDQIIMFPSVLMKDLRYFIDRILHNVQCTTKAFLSQHKNKWFPFADHTCSLLSLGLTATWKHHPSRTVESTWQQSTVDILKWWIQLGLTADLFVLEKSGHLSHYL